MSGFENKIRYSDLKINISNFYWKFSYFLINEFCDVIRDKALIKWFNTCKNMDEYKNMVKYFYI